MKFNSFLVGQPTNKKNYQSTLDSLMNRQITQIQSELRHQRQDLHDIKLMINKLLISEHLDYQVDNYYANQESNSVAES